MPNYQPSHKGQFKPPGPEPLGRTIGLRLPESADSKFRAIAGENATFFARYLLLKALLSEGWAEAEELRSRPYRVVGTAGETGHQIASSLEDAIERASQEEPGVMWGEAVEDWP